MGKVWSSVKHPFRNFNVESRAHKIISQDKPQPAPRFLKDEIDIKRMQKEFPDVFEESLKKNVKLDQHLKDVFVVSHDPVTEIPNPEKPLPQDRSQPDYNLFGIKEPNNVPIGKATLKTTLEFISQHQIDPEKNSAAEIASKHNLPKDVVENILKYFRVFEIYIPDQLEKTKATFVGPSLPKYKIHSLDEMGKFLPPPKFKKSSDEN